MTQRSCSGCSLCCKLVPLASESDKLHVDTLELAISRGMLTRAAARYMIPDFKKPAGERCPHQRATGCRVYERRPFGCRFWNCRWLVNDDTADLSRPDRSHYVIDVSPDYVTSQTDDGQPVTIPVIQIWIDPKHPDAHRDPALRRYLERRAHDGWAALIRFDNLEAMFLAAPPMSMDGEWHEIRTKLDPEEEHTIEDKLKKLGSFTMVMEQ